MFKNITSLTKMEEIINNETFAFFYITQPNCSVCHGLQPQIEQIMEKFPKIKTYHIDALAVPEISGQYSLFSAPVLLLYVDGKETIREARFVQTEKLTQNLEKITNLYA